jgi:hypothetical protein
MPPPPMGGTGGMTMGTGGMTMGTGGTGGTGGTSGTMTSVACSTIAICGGDDHCHFKSDVAGLQVACYLAADSKPHMIVVSKGLPDHAYQDPPGGIAEQSYRYDIPLAPTVNTSRANKPCATDKRGALGLKGLALNGVAIYQPLNNELRDPFSPPTGYTPEHVDYCGAHGVDYHYHRNPECLFGLYYQGKLTTGPLGVATDSNQVQSSLAHGDWAKPSGIIGFSIEGFPIYGPYADAAGNPHTGLDACNGKRAADGSYAYYATLGRFPYLIGCEGPGADPATMTADDWSCTTAR